ncbi:hypothetical protein MKX01_031646 [Papaver californicum]|nr:hypothetical protein MKX01_031646 [Papaver californicum]
MRLWYASYKFPLENFSLHITQLHFSAPLLLSSDHLQWHITVAAEEELAMMVLRISNYLYQVVSKYKEVMSQCGLLMVNEANEKMLGGGGLDGVIHRAAGPELREDWYTVPEVRFGIRCPKGEEVRITLNCLKLAKENSIEYIAFPAISCGAYGYSCDEAAALQYLR